MMHRLYRITVACKQFVRTDSNKQSCRLLLQNTRPACCAFPSNEPRSRSQCTTTDFQTARRYVPRRTLMYVPGHDLKKLHKIPKLGVDCAVLECEDGVALNKKAEARENIRGMLDELGEVEGVDIAVRVNSVSSGLMEQDLNVIMTAQRLPETILLPKTNTVEDVILFTDRLRAALGDRTQGYCPHLITYVESAEGLMNMTDILRRAQAYSMEGVYNLDGVVFGSDDFCADIGAERSVDASELTYARQKIVMVAKGYRIQAIDMVFTDYKDAEGLRVQSEQGARKGYTGKQLIHPNQVSVVRDAFTPSSERVDWATELIYAFQEHQNSGVSMRFSTFDVDNDMNTGTNCAKTFTSGWWFNSCFSVNLNGVWYGSPSYVGPSMNGVIWDLWDHHSNGYSLKAKEIKLRTEDF